MKVVNPPIQHVQQIPDQWCWAAVSTMMWNRIPGRTQKDQFEIGKAVIEKLQGVHTDCYIEDDQSDQCNSIQSLGDASDQLALGATPLPFTLKWHHIVKFIDANKPIGLCLESRSNPGLIHFALIGGYDPVNQQIQLFDPAKPGPVISSLGIISIDWILKTEFYIYPELFGFTSMEILTA